MRAAVTILAIVIGLFFVVAVYTRSARYTNQSVPESKELAAKESAAAKSLETPEASKTTESSEASKSVKTAESAATSTANSTSKTVAGSTAPATSTNNSANIPATPQLATTEPASQVSPLAPLHVVSAEAQSSVLGNDTAASPYAMEVHLSAWGASISKITLAHYTQNAMTHLPYQTQGRVPVTGADGKSYSYYPFAARFITVNGQKIALDAIAWKRQSDGIYTTDLLLPDNTPAVRLTRHYVLNPDKNDYQLLCKQEVQNLTDKKLEIVWEQSIQTEQPQDLGSYMGDQRRLYVGYYDTKYDPGHLFIVTDNGYIAHTKVLKNWEDNKPFFWPVKNGKAPYEMVWFGEANRYFFSVVHRPVIQVSPATTQAKGASKTSSKAQVQPPKVEPLQTLFPHLGLQVVMGQPPVMNQTLPVSTTPASTQPASTQPAAVKLKKLVEPQPILIYSLTSKTVTIAPKSHANLDLTLFTGPRDPYLIEQQPYNALGFENLIRYQLSCSFCTFQWLAKVLLQFLRGIHFLLHDWGMAIIVLVLVVRVILHPITKKSQIAMTKMGKQMSTLKPEMDKIKKKYADDSTRQNQEVMKLYKERGINPAGMLGCLPMFLQTPIWIALYAMLYFAIELRHQSAFYGVFQALSGGHWAFLADLSSPDNFLHFSHSFKLNLIFVHPEFSGINIIPLLMAVFYYFQQAFIMPPAANDQQAQQQKIGKYMTIMVPIFLYSAPSGLTLYMLASSMGGMVDGWIVRRHINRQEKEGTLFAPKVHKEPKPGGLWDRIQKAMAKQQDKIVKAQKKQQPPKVRKRK